MGDMSAEPSMEDILASIKRVIKEGETQAAPRRMSPRPVASTIPSAPPHDPASAASDRDEVLELRQPMPPFSADDTPAPSAADAPDRIVPPVAGLHARGGAADATAPHAPVQPSVPPAAQAAPAAAGVSSATAEATRDALGALSRLVVRPEPGSDGTLEGLVRDMLKPMLADWLDANLPGLVEDMVAREIARITNRG